MVRTKLSEKKRFIDFFHGHQESIDRYYRKHKTDFKPSLMEECFADDHEGLVNCSSYYRKMKYKKNDPITNGERKAENKYTYYKRHGKHKTDFKPSLMEECFAGDPKSLANYQSYNRKIHHKKHDQITDEERKTAAAYTYYIKNKKHKTDFKSSLMEKCFANDPEGLTNLHNYHRKVYNKKHDQITDEEREAGNKYTYYTRHGKHKTDFKPSLTQECFAGDPKSLANYQSYNRKMKYKKNDPITDIERAAKAQYDYYRRHGKHKTETTPSLTQECFANDPAGLTNLHNYHRKVHNKAQDQITDIERAAQAQYDYYRRHGKHKTETTPSLAEQCFADDPFAVTEQCFAAKKEELKLNMIIIEDMENIKLKQHLL